MSKYFYPAANNPDEFFEKEVQRLEKEALYKLNIAKNNFEIYKYKEKEDPEFYKSLCKSLECAKIKYSDKESIREAAHRSMYHWSKPKQQKDNENLYEPVQRTGYACLITTESLSRSPQIRVPSLKRKNAWKRFYKRYPELKGVKVIIGRSQSSEIKLNNSTIKLK